MSKRDWAVAAAIAACAVGLVACGGGGSEADAGGAVAGGEEAAFEEGRLEMAECMRKHGVDMPDPVAGDKGLTIQKGGKGAAGAALNLDDPATAKALAACEDEVDFQPPEITPEQEEEMKEQMLAFAQCMREHGIDMPDPEFQGGGMATMRIGGPDGPGDVDGPAMEAAQEACQGELPEGGTGFKAGP